MNYVALSNTSPVIHMYIVPRYKEAREFVGIFFKDTRWGQTPPVSIEALLKTLYNFLIGKETLAALRRNSPP